MDKKAIYNLSYGVFMVSTKAGEVANGCITNTCIQVASNPVRIAISVLNSNYTCDLIKESGIFAVSILDNDCTFETIKHFGFQSGRDVDKFENITPPTDCNDVPYLGCQSCAVISGKVVDPNLFVTRPGFRAERPFYTEHPPSAGRARSTSTARRRQGALRSFRGRFPAPPRRSKREIRPRCARCRRRP